MTTLRGWANWAVTVALCASAQGATAGESVFTQLGDEGRVIQEGVHDFSMEVRDVVDLSRYQGKDSLFCVQPLTPEGFPDSQGFVIESAAQYQALASANRSPLGDCAKFKLPKADLSKRTILGKYASGGGCSTEFNRKVYRDDANKRIIFRVEVVSSGSCEKMAVSMNWISVPKLPKDYAVFIEVR